MPSRRTLALIVAVAVIALPLSGLLDERFAESRDARLFRAPGRLVDVGGRRLHVNCIGRGSPTVVFEASGFSNSSSYEVARTELADRTEVCSYDRAGVGWSDPLPATASIGTLADDLHRLIDAAPLRPPFVIVTSSIGGLVTELFARRRPEQIAGLVFADAATSDMLPVARPTLESWKMRAACAAAIVAGRVGIIRLLDPFKLRAVSSDTAARSAALMYRAQPWVGLCTLIKTIAVTEREFDAAPPLPRDVPLTVLTAASMNGVVPAGLDVDVSSLAPLRTEMHHRLAQRSDRGSWRLVDPSDHQIASSRPDAVVRAVREMLARSDNQR
jgi:pimeloyl-ACP methyl ester carboxylesterase